VALLQIQTHELRHSMHLRHSVYAIYTNTWANVHNMSDRCASFSPKKALQLVVLLKIQTNGLKHPMHLRHPVCAIYTNTWVNVQSMPCLYTSFSAKRALQWVALLRNDPTNWGILCIFATLYVLSILILERMCSIRIDSTIYTNAICNGLLEPTHSLLELWGGYDE